MLCAHNGIMVPEISIHFFAATINSIRVVFFGRPLSWSACKMHFSFICRSKCGSERTSEQASKTVYLNDMILHFRIEHSLRRSILICVRCVRPTLAIGPANLHFFCCFYIHIVAGFENLATIIPMRKNTIQEKHNR